MPLTDLQSQIFGSSSSVLTDGGGSSIASLGTLLGTAVGGPVGGIVGGSLGQLGGEMFGSGGSSDYAKSGGSFITLGSISGKASNTMLYLIIAVLAYFLLRR